MDYRKRLFGIESAELAAKQSKALKLKVGAAAFRDGRPIVNGYNGTPPGEDNTCEDVIDGQLKTRPEVAHAERNLIDFSARHGIRLEGSTLYITHSPCMDCARAILNVGFSEVFFLHQYRDPTGSEFLRKRGIVCEQFIKE